MLGPISKTSFSLAVAALLSTVTAGTVDAKECKADSDCAAGFECVLGGSAPGSGGSSGTSAGGPGSGAATGTTKESSGGGGASGAGSSGNSSGAGAAAGPACAGPDCADSSPVAPPFPVDAGAPGVTTGTCQVKVLSCTTKADCPTNLDCVKGTAVVTSCSPNTTCDTAVAPPPITGTCKAVCNVDADCPAPLVCKLEGVTCSGGGSVSSDGTVTTMPTTCTGGTKICSYQPVTCSSDSECKDSNTQCVKVSEYRSCTDSGSTGCARSADGGITCTAPPEPPVCTTTTVNNCIPKQIDCDAGQTCPAGSSCFDFTYFEGASIPGWSTPMPSKACLPDGLILVIKGQAGGGSTSVESNPTRGGGTDTGTLGGGGGSKGSSAVDAGVSLQVPAATADAGTEAASVKASDGGCALGGTPSGSFHLWLALGLAGMALRFTRRRR